MSLHRPHNPPPSPQSSTVSLGEPRNVEIEGVDGCVDTVGKWHLDGRKVVVSWAGRRYSRGEITIFPPPHLSAINS